MICENCGTELQDPNQTFCPNCGIPLRKKIVFQFNDELGKYKEIELDKDVALYNLLDSDFILLFVDPKLFRVWIWQGNNVTTRMKFVSARIASSIRDRYGINYKISSVDEGSETAEFKTMIGLEEEIENTKSQTGLAYEGTQEDLSLLESLSREKILLLLEKIIKAENKFVLLISEVPEILNLSKKFLILGDIETITFSNTQEALKIIEEHYNEISMVFLDTMIPHRGAYTLLKQIRSNEKYKDIQVVLFSSKDKKNGNDKGFFPFPYIFKPPTSPRDIGAVGELQAKEFKVKEPKQAPYCKYCAALLAKGESICHVCGNKVL